MIREEDAVRIYPEVKHWHGATPDNWLVHLSITPNAQKGDAVWMEPVTDEAYNNLKLKRRYDEESDNISGAEGNNILVAYFSHSGNTRAV